MEFIIHYISKEQNVTSATLTLKSQLSTFGDGVEEAVFLEKLEKLFKSDGMLYGSFPESSQFLDDYKEHSSQLSDDLDLIEFSKESAEKLRGAMADSRLATGGFICYIAYESSGNKYLMVLILNLTDAVTLKEDGDKYTVVNTEHLDLSHLRMGLKFNVSAYSNNDEVCVYFQSGGSREPSDYFYKDYAGTEDVIPRRKSTRKLVDWIDKELDAAASFNSCERHEMKSRFDNFLEGKDKVTLVGLKELFYPGDREKQEVFIQSANDAMVPQEIVLDKSVLSKYRTYNVKLDDSNVNLKFTARDDENHKIIPDHVHKTLTIPNVDEKILEQLK
ncbi:MAG: nucleoid-associated protein [Methyloprofundus sp.]|nr:nucleoid-associated protein [Methyloprofundus sp.]